MNDLVTRLRSVDMFAQLSDKELARIADLGSVHDHPAGSVLAEQDRSGVGFHLLLSGSADVQVGGHPRGNLKPGDYFGEISLLDGEPRSATVTVGPDGATTFALTSWKFSPLLDEYPTVTRALVKVLCARLRRAEAALDAR